MAYSKHTWIDDELITADKLNNIENGIAENGSSSGELATGSFQNGDILTLQTADGKTRKMKYTEVKIGVEPVEKIDTSTTANWPALRGTEEDCATLRKFLQLYHSSPETTLVSFSVFLDLGEGISCISPLKEGQFLTNENNQQIFGAAATLSALQSSQAVSIFSLEENKGCYERDEIIPTFPIYFICKGFLPVEE